MNSVGGEADPLQCRVRSAGVKLARVANQCGIQRESADATKSIAESTGRDLARSTLGVNFGIDDCANLT